jgi:ferredoxin
VLQVIEVGDYCAGHGKCYRIAPELLRAADDHGHAEYIGPAIDPADEAAVARGLNAINCCPEQALSWKTL